MTHEHFPGWPEARLGALRDFYIYDRRQIHDAWEAMRHGLTSEVIGASSAAAKASRQKRAEESCRLFLNALRDGVYEEVVLQRSEHQVDRWKRSRIGDPIHPTAGLLSPNNQYVGTESGEHPAIARVFLVAELVGSGVALAWYPGPTHLLADTTIRFISGWRQWTNANVNWGAPLPNRLLHHKEIAQLFHRARDAMIPDQKSDEVLIRYLLATWDEVIAGLSAFYDTEYVVRLAYDHQKRCLVVKGPEEEAESAPESVIPQIDSEADATDNPDPPRPHVNHRMMHELFRKSPEQKAADYAYAYFKLGYQEILDLLRKANGDPRPVCEAIKRADKRRRPTPNDAIITVSMFLEKLTKLGIPHADVPPLILP